MTASVVPRPERRDPFKPNLLHEIADPIERIVIVRASRIGDFLCATPALRSLRHALPRSEITLIALPFIEPLAARSPHIDSFVAFPGFPGMADQFFDPRRALAFFEQMQMQAFDLAIQLHGSGVYANTFTVMLGAKWSAGYVRNRDYAETLDAALIMPTKTIREPERWTGLTQFLGAEMRGHEIEFPLWEDDRRTADRILGVGKPPYIGIQPGARDLSKCWKPERFAQTGQALLDRFGGTLVLLGHIDEKRVAQQMGRRLNGPHLDLTGSLSLPVLGAVIEHLDLLITNDSGPAHIAYAFETPSITIFGGTDPRQWAPSDSRSHRGVAQNIPCRPCAEGSCTRNYACLDGVRADQVTAAACALLSHRPKTKGPHRGPL